MRKRDSLRFRLLALVLLVLATALGTMGFWLISETRDYYLEDARISLLRQVYLAELVVREYFDGSNLDVLAQGVGSSANTRTTLIMPDGTVVGETERGSETLENHLERLEVQAALQGIPGYDLRQSRTTGRQTLYAAVPSYDRDGRMQGVVRLALDVSTVMQNFARLSLVTAVGGGLALALGALLAYFLARQISLPLERMAGAARNMASGDFSCQVSETGTTETRDLARALNTMSLDLKRQFEAVRAAAERLGAVLASMRDGVILIDEDGRIELINPAAVEVLGITESATLGQPLTILNRFPDLSAILTESRRKSEASASRVSLGGRMAQRQVRAGVVPLESGKTLVSLQDLTDVYRSLDVRRDFVANVSHELRTPITAIRLLVENLLSGALDDRVTAEDFLRRAETETLRLATMVEELLTISRLESGSEETIRQTVVAQDLVTEVTDELKELLRQKDQSVVTEGHMKGILFADREKLRQVLVNFLDNAMKFSPRNATITVGVSESATTIELYVRDQGPGVLPEHLPRVFERFFMGSPSRGSGTGLGLAIVKHIAEVHGGSAFVRSKYGQGATFGISLPRDPR